MKANLLGVVMLLALVTACGSSTSATSTPSASAPAPATTTSASAAATLAPPPTIAAPPTTKATAAVPAPTATRSLATASPTTRTDAASPTGSAPATPTFVNDPELAPLLLTVTDLPTGWSATPATGPGGASPVCNAPSLQATFGAVPTAEADFQQSDLGPFVVESIGRYDTPDTATQVLQYMQQSAACGTWTSSDGAQNTMTAQPAPGLGDESLAYRFTVKSAQFTLESDIVVVRVGAIVLQLLNASLQSVDSALTQSLVQQAVAKLP